MVVSFTKPTRRIVTESDLEAFKNSATKSQILGFIADLNASVRGVANSADCGEAGASGIIGDLVKLLGEVEKIVDKHPAKDQTSSRFGKPEFVDFYDELAQSAGDIIEPVITPSEAVSQANKNQAIGEVATYLIESWGNRQRIDYGSGHELNFLSFLLCLKCLGLFDPEIHYKPLILKVFKAYLQLMRKIQTMYWLEPAGSHGVWGLDDYHFLPFMFGSSQLATHKHLRPKSIHDPDIVDMYHTEYMYLGCIKFINTVKTASLRWHSPLIDDISGVKTWSKVNEGMIKMYDAEVLGKLPIMQHFMFGSLIAAPEGVSPPQEGPDDDEHVHFHNTWADCCGIKVPSAIAASQSQHLATDLRPVPGVIPFD